jgi:hypothetical protein
MSGPVNIQVHPVTQCVDHSDRNCPTSTKEVIKVGQQLCDAARPKISWWATDVNHANRHLHYVCQLMTKEYPKEDELTVVQFDYCNGISEGKSLFTKDSVNF